MSCSAFRHFFRGSRVCREKQHDAALLRSEHDLLKALELGIRLFKLNRIPAGFA